MHDGSRIRLHRIAEDHDLRDRAAAVSLLERHRADGNLVTGLLFCDDEAINLHERMNLARAPLNAMSEAELCPGAKALEAINQSLR
jgi:2-oxoglutarate ferredoxin oxidoreductase subunit beta